MKAPRPSLRHVADACGVTIMTVNRALRPGSSVATETRARILEVVERLGYHPRPNLGRPRLCAPTRRSIELILGDHRNSSFSQALLATISQELAERGRDCVLRSTVGDFNAFLTLCETMRTDRELPTLILGYLPPHQLAMVLEIRPKAILVDHTGDPEVEIPCHSIGFDNIEAARLVTDHLLTLDRRRILLLTGPAGHYFTRDAVLGYQQALAGRHIPFDKALVVGASFGMQQAADAIDEALIGGLGFDAVVGNDDMALAAIARLVHHGRRVPQDIPVAGIDGMPIGAFLQPALTTARLDHTELGRLAAVCVCNEAELPTAPLRRRLLPQLLIRNSTKDP